MRKVPDSLLQTKLSSSTLLELYSLNTMIRNSETGICGKHILDDIYNNNSIWAPSHGTLYPLLAKMQENGYITEIEGTDFKKKLYRITKKGLEYYKQNANNLKYMLLESSMFYKTMCDSLYSGSDVILDKVECAE